MPNNSILALVSFLSAVTHAQTTDEAAMQSRVNWVYTQNPRNLAKWAWRMPKAEREQFIEEFKKRVPSDAPQFSTDRWLLFLGDRQSVEKSAAEFALGDPLIANDLGITVNPTVIGLLSPHFAGSEPYRLPAGDVKVPPKSFAAVFTTVSILGNSPVFSSDVRDWANGLRDPEPALLREEIRRWWDDNKEHFSREDYLAVTPGRPVRTNAEVIAENRRELGLPELPPIKPPADRRVSLTIDPNISASAPSTTSKEPTTSDAEHGNTVYLIGSAVALLLIAGLWVVASNARQKHS